MYQHQILISIKSVKDIKNQKTKQFFYPANGSSYKNHDIIIKACMKLEKRKVKNYEVILTLNGNENESIKKIRSNAKKQNINITFTGVIPREEVFSLYSNSILLFPSYLETFGLPLLEKRLIGGLILAVDCLYAREVLEGYNNVAFFEWDDSIELADKMEELIRKEFNIREVETDKKNIRNTSILDVLFYKGENKNESRFIN